MYKKTKQIFVASVFSIGMILGTSSITLAEEKAAYESKTNVEFEENTEVTKPVDPTNPDPTNPVQPQPDPDVPGEEIEDGTQGPLSIDYASHVNFGKIKKTGNAATYTAKPITITLSDESEKEVAPYVQVTDNRGTNEGWSLSVSQESQLTNVETSNELKGATINIEEGIISGTADTEGLSARSIELTPNGEKHSLFNAEAESGGGTFVLSFGEVDNIGVTLDLVAGTKIDDGLYQATLKWTLEDVPTN